MSLVCLTLRPIFTFNQILWGGSSRAARFARGAAASRQRARQRLASHWSLHVFIFTYDICKLINLNLILLFLNSSFPLKTTDRQGFARRCFARCRRAADPRAKRAARLLPQRQASKAIAILCCLVSCGA